VILTGGTAVRLGGVDKSTIEVRGRTLLEHALAATAGATEVVVVGSEVPTSRPVTWTRERPPGGGPAAGVLAGVDALSVPPELVCVLAVDMPRFDERTLGRLLEALDAADEQVDAACLGDDAGHTQWLAGVYRYAALLAARRGLHGDAHGLSTRRLVEPLRIAVVQAVADEARDVDTWEDLRDLDDGSGPS
jgi:molybdopterin-guanine dinucleotide biosynthesis protein A